MRIKTLLLTSLLFCCVANGHAGVLAGIGDTVEELRYLISTPRGNWDIYLTAEPGGCFEEVETYPGTKRRLCVAPNFEDGIHLGETMPPYQMSGGGFPNRPVFQVSWIDNAGRKHQEAIALARIAKSMGTTGGTLLVELGQEQIRVLGAKVITPSLRSGSQPKHTSYWDTSRTPTVLSRELLFKKESNGEALPSDYFDAPNRAPRPWTLWVEAPAQGCTILLTAKFNAVAGVRPDRETAPGYLLHRKGDPCFNRKASAIPVWTTQELVPSGTFTLSWVDTKGLQHTGTLEFPQALQGREPYGGKLQLTLSDNDFRLWVQEPDLTSRVTSPSPNHHYDTFTLLPMRELLSRQSTGGVVADNWQKQLDWIRKN